MNKNDRDNHANQLNPNNDAYWQSPGHDERPEGEDDFLTTEDDTFKLNPFRR